MSIDHIDDFGRAFLRLALEINKHIEGYVDAYFGPDEIKKKIDSVKALSPQQLFENHQLLENLIPTDDPNRHKYLVALTNSMGFMIRKLNGEIFDYLEEVGGLFGISPELIDEKVILNIHKLLDDQIPGKGSLAERIKKRKQELRIPKADIPNAISLIQKEIRHRSGTLFSFNAKESIEIKYVKEKPWGAYNWYLGDYHSLIEINLDIDWDPLSLSRLMIHETYPGHHTELQTKEQILFKELGYAEESCMLLLSPRPIIMEGIATTAIEIISSEMEIFEWIAEDLVTILELPKVKPGELYIRSKVSPVLQNSVSNAAILYHSGNINEEDAIEYLQTYGLFSYELAKNIFKMVVDPLYQTYVFTYTEGYRLIDQAALGKSKLPLFKRLLTEQILPDDLLSPT